MHPDADRFVSELIAYARERNRFIELRDPILLEYANELECPLAPPSTTPWTDEKIQSARSALVGSPTRRQTLETFLKFLIQEAQNLVLYGGRAGFYRQHAYNLIADGPIGGEAARAVVNLQASPMLLREPTTRPAYNPYPAVVRFLEKQSEYVPRATGPYQTEPRISAFRRVLAVSLDGRRALSANLDAALWVWDLESGRCLHKLQARTPSEYDYELPEMIEHAAITPDGRIAVSLTFDGELRAWDIETGQCIRLLNDGVPSERRHARPTRSIGITADGRFVIVGGLTDNLTIWDIDSGECINESKPVGGTSGVWSICANRGTALSIKDSIVVLWDIFTGKPLQAFSEPENESSFASITVDGRFVVSHSKDGFLRLWDVESGE